VDLGRVGCHHAGVGIRLLAIGLIAGLLAACSGGGADPDPTPAPTPSTRPSSVAPSSTPATPSRTGPLTTGPNVRPGEKPPVFPELAKQHTANGALAFASYFVRAFNWGYETNDPYLVRKISEARCKACASYVKGLESLTSSGGVLREGLLTPRSASIFHGTLKIHADFAIDLALDEAPVVIEKPSARPSTATVLTKNDHSLLLVTWVSGSWKVTELTAK
jgi:hypothetical protein